LSHFPKGGALATVMAAYLVMDSDIFSQLEHLRQARPDEEVLIDFTSHRPRSDFVAVHVNGTIILPFPPFSPLLLLLLISV
jgi:hypothetical protein